MPTPKSGYFLKSGRQVPGTTTILGRWKESGGLLQWAGKTGYDQGVAGLPYNLYAKRDEAGDVGTYIHALVEWHLEGEDPETKPAPDSSLDTEAVNTGLRGYGNFLNWEKQNNLFVMSWEKPLVSEKYAFGGTPDGIFHLANADKVDLGDWKSGKRVYADTLLQIAAYILVWEENFPDQPIGGAHVVRFSKSFGDFEHRYFEDLEKEKIQFLRLREAYDADKELRKRI